MSPRTFHSGTKPGAFVISLDLELFWGMRDKRTIAGYGTRILGVRQAIPRMLETFQQYDVKATFATVGLLFAQDKRHMLQALPAERPSYVDPHLSPYNGHIDGIGSDEADDPYHFGNSLIRMLQEHPQHEIACHTFAHYYCLENGQTREQFKADLEAAIAIAAELGISLRSFVFPRNQYNGDYLAICGRHGIEAYRGNENNWLQQARNGQEETRIRRAFRLLDTWLAITGPNTHPWPQAGIPLPVDVPASRFLRPYASSTRALEGLRRKRITKALDHAARNGRIFHLWWHPHNFGTDLDENIRFLDSVLGHFNALRSTHGMQSMTMGDVARSSREDHG